MYAEILTGKGGFAVVAGAVGQTVADGFPSRLRAFAWAMANGYHNTAWDAVFDPVECPACRPNGWNLSDGGLFACDVCSG